MTEQTAQASTAYPKTRDEVTAAGLARHYVARSLTAYNLITDPNAPGRTGHLASQHLDTFVATALLIRLRLVDHGQDEVAREIWDAMANPPETVGLLEHWLREMDIDPASLPTPNLKPTRDAAEVDRMRAELEQARTDAQKNRRAATVAADATGRLLAQLSEAEAERDRYAAELAATAKQPADEKRWNEAIDWLLNSRHTADPDIQGPFWAYVDGHITRDELDTFRAPNVMAREREIAARTKTAATPEQPAPDSGAPLDATTNA